MAEFLNAQQIVNGKLSRRKSLPPITDTNGNLTTDGVALTNVFNKYFASVFTNDDGNIPQLSSQVDASVERRDASFGLKYIFCILFCSCF